MNCRFISYRSLSGWQPIQEELIVMGRKRKRFGDEVVTSSVGCEPTEVKFQPSSVGPDPDQTGLDGPAPRNAANERERARMRVLSRAFTRLKTSLPWVPADTKLSKLDTLRLASCYIAHLSRLLAEDDDAKAGVAPTAGVTDDVHSSTFASSATTSTPNIHPINLVSSSMSTRINWLLLVDGVATNNSIE